MLSIEGPRENGYGQCELSPSGRGREAGANIGVEWSSGRGRVVGVDENLKRGTN